MTYEGEIASFGQKQELEQEELLSARKASTLSFERVKNGWSKVPGGGTGFVIHGCKSDLKSGVGMIHLLSPTIALSPIGAILTDWVVAHFRVVKAFKRETAPPAGRV